MARKLTDPSPVLDMKPITEKERHSPLFGERKRPLPAARYVPADFIEPDPDQPRQHFDESKLAELAESIRSRGIEQPLVVLDFGNNRYQLVAGERRWRAARIAGLDEVPILAHRALDDADVDEYQLNEFLLHEEPSDVEKQRFLRSYKDRHDFTWKEVAAKLGVSADTIQGYMSLEDAPDRVKELVEEGAITSEHYRRMTALPEELVVPFAEKVAREGIPTKKVKEAREEFLRGAEAAPPEEAAVVAHSSSAGGPEPPVDAPFDGADVAAHSSSRLPAWRPPAPVAGPKVYGPIKMTATIPPDVHEIIASEMDRLKLKAYADFVKLSIDEYLRSHGLLPDRPQ